MLLRVSPHYAASPNLLWELELWIGSSCGPVGMESMFHIVHRMLLLS
jgi:hypothetical protein